MKSVAAAEAALSSFQHAQLRRASEATGRLKDLLYFHAARRDEARFAELEESALGGHPEDRLVCQVLSGRDLPTDIPGLIAGGAIADPWVTLSLVKYLLRAERIKEAVSLAVARWNQGASDTLPLNVIARHAACTGYVEMARQLAERSLLVAPKQGDVVDFLDRLDRGRSVSAPCLDRLPPACRVAYYLPCYNVEAHIARTLDAVTAQCHPLDEILIIDDASPDASVSIAGRYPVRVIQHSENRGLAAARNTAWQHTTAEFIATVDTDACPDPGYVQRALMEFEQGPPELALTGGRLIEVHIDTPADEFRATFMSQDPGRLRWYVGGGAPAEGGEPAAAWTVNAKDAFVTGSDTVARRAALEAVGGYPERHRTNAEDSALCARLREEGMHFLFSPNCHADHYRRDSVLSVLKTAWNYGFWHRTDLGFYENAVALMSLVDDHFVASQQYMAKSVDEKRSHLVYVEFLSAFYSVQLDLQHAIREGLLSPGQALTVQRGLDAVVHTLDLRFGEDLLNRVQADLAGSRFPDSGNNEPLDSEAQARFDLTLENIQRDFARFNVQLYRLLLHK